ncbi:helix-turn-helix transcriptional regulator [Actinomycetospora sp. CA-101289]|uniref:helix-turn-helix transcriptional regulator n=1 Tax=Actinomycetospora sp. CA-101289 TaxID=3239893 RepID=UPI003D958E3F
MAIDGHDGRTRDLIVRRLLEHGPTTAMDLAGELGLSGAAVRRHLDALVIDGTVCTRDAPRASGRGRGRPARQHLLTEQGRRRAGRGEADVADLAVAALAELADAAGEDAVRAFARRRVRDLLGEHREEVEAHDERSARVDALAGALSREGYAASSRPTSAGAQLCQHHCPVAGVAAHFPQLCEAETEVFAELLGTHVQRLSTIARGDAACTTHVPRQPGPPASSTTATTHVVKGRQVV